MVRSLTHWTKTLSFPTSKNKDINEVRSSFKSSSPSPSNNGITEISQIIYPESDLTAVSSLVFCIHHKVGCKWSDDLKKLKAHLNTCKYDAISCLNKCGSQIPRVMMIDHLKYTCLNRRVLCEFCQEEFTKLDLEEHNNVCNRQLMDCEAKCGTRFMRCSLSSHQNFTCMKRMVCCPHCNKQFSADTLSIHTSNCIQSPLPLPLMLAHNSRGLPVKQKELGTYKLEKQICKYKIAGCMFEGTQQEQTMHLKKKKDEHSALMFSLVVRQNQEIAKLQNEFSKLSTNYSGILLWKITEWSAKMKNAKLKDNIELMSVPFYTSQYGYKLQASLFLNGNGPGEGSHISVYIKILPGEYDSLLKWPFTHSVTFTLFEQGNLGHQNGIAESFIPDPSWQNFKRPSTEPDSLGFGFPKFVSHELFYKRPFIQLDSVFLRIKVDATKTIAV